MGPRLVLLLVALLLIAGTALVGTTPMAAGTSTPHAPILIQGDANFTAANGVVAGSGTGSDPYVIAGWSITMSDTDGLCVIDTSLPFVIRDVSVSFASYSGHPYTGIVLQNVSGAVLENLSLTIQGTALSIRESANVTVLQSGFQAWTPAVLVEQTSRANLSFNRIAVPSYPLAWPSIGLGVRNSDDAVVAGNAFDVLGTAIQLSGSLRAQILGNQLGDGGLQLDGTTLEHYRSHAMSWNFLSEGRPLVYLKDASHVTVGGGRPGQVIIANCTDVTVSDVALHDGSVGVTLAYVRGALVDRVNASSNSVAGLFVDASFNTTVQSSLFSRNVWGIEVRHSTNTTVRGNGVFLNRNIGLWLWSASGVAVYHNNLAQNEYDVSNLSSTAVRLDAGYPAGGNYWYSYTGSDVCTGPLQNSCLGPDGIGDWPMVVDGLSDRYPLMASNASANTPPSVRLDIQGPGGSWHGDHLNFSYLYNPFAVAFDAEDPISRLSYRWDYKSDGIWDTDWSLWTDSGYFETSTPGNFSVTVQVRDTGGLVAQATVVILVPALPDFTPPSLAVQLPAAAVAGAAIPVWARAGDASSVANLTLEYRTEWSGPSTSLAMADQGNGSYLAWIPGQSAGARLYIRAFATDVHGNSAVVPTGTNFLVLDVQPPAVDLLRMWLPTLLVLTGLFAIILWEGWSRVGHRWETWTRERRWDQARPPSEPGPSSGKPPSP